MSEKLTLLLDFHVNIKQILRDFHDFIDGIT